MLDIVINLRDVSLMRSALLFLSRDNTKLMEQIGYYMLLEVRKSFAKEESPYGAKWPELSEATLNNRVNINNPILNDTGALSHSFRYVARNKSVAIGTDCIYAATQQFGAKRGQYGSMRNGSPIPWGDIPSRQMLPIKGGRVHLTSEQKKDIKRIIDNYIRAGFREGFGGHRRR